MRAYERLINYVKVFTPSNEESDTVPSSACQFDLAHLLVKELKELGIENAEVDGQCYVYASIPATEGWEQVPALGLIAHMDTVSDFCSHPVCPVVHENYDGKDLPLTSADGKEDSGRVLEVAKFPWLAGFQGQTLITSDGTTILGADDKAGVAEIMTVAERILQEKLPHGKICIGFTPDEEIGMGAAHFNVARFGADVAYTLDGDLAGEIQFENFNAAAATVHIVGYNVHPGSAKDVMINAAGIASEFQAGIPEAEKPETTDGYDGFYHLLHIEGDVSEAKLSYIIRDHDWARFEQKKAYMKELEQRLNEKYGSGTVTVNLKDQYRNMKEKIDPCPQLIENAVKAAEEAGLRPVISPIRGGTDGATLSFMGLPCPNLGTGGSAFHGPYEHITAEAMDRVVEMLLKLIQCFGE